MDDRLRSALADDERLRYDAPLRTDGVVAITDRRLLVIDDEPVNVPLENVQEIRIESFDWFLGVLSVALVGFGLYSLTLSVVGGIAFTAVGLASCYRTYARRNRVIVEPHTGRKPVDFFLEDTAPFSRSFEDAIERFEAAEGLEDG